MAETKQKYWSKLIAEQEASGQKALPFCRARGIGAYSFYKWRSRLREKEVAEFALVETTPATSMSPDPALELILRNGERLRIGNQVTPATLRIVLEAVRG